MKLNTAFKVYEFDTIDSTNDFCKSLAIKGEENAIVIAREQTKGKGRLNRSFYSPKDSGIYMSILLTPDLKPEDSTLITTAAAVAVSLAIDKISGRKSFIKWVNDIYMDGKKVCGILTESCFKGSDYRAVLGIGINLYTSAFPDDIKDKAGSLFSEENDLKESLINSVLSNFFEIYNTLPKKEYMKIYKEKSMLIGKRVSFIKDNIKYFGTVSEITDSAEIVIKSEEETITLFAGEVSLEI